MMSDEAGLSLGADGDSDFLRPVESSTCLLLASPSPDPTPPHPLANVALFSADDGSSGQLHPEDGAADSSSSGDSASVALQDPVSAQLINNISMLEYRTLSKADRIPGDEITECKINGNLSASNRALPKLVEWNWVVVRKILLWVVVSALVACAATVVALIYTLPKSCDPQLPWYQGALFYEVFPASFHDSNNDGYGDLRGLKNKLDYIQNLGASTIRLNYIFEGPDYPEHYTHVTNITRIARKIGSINDFDDLVTEVHNKNMTIVLDIPIIPSMTDSNGTITEVLAEALTFWSAHKVDGFYLKDLEKVTKATNFASSLRRWKTVIGPDKILMASNITYEATSGVARNLFLSKIDLVDVHLNVSRGIEGLKKQINDILTSPLFSKPSYPWIHWNLGDVKSARLSGENKSDAIALILLSVSLPGTVSIFYGDEIGLRGLKHASEIDFPEFHLIHGLVAMRWPENTQKDGSCKVSLNGVLPWNCGEEEPDFSKLEIIRSAVELRKKTPTLYACWTRSDTEWKGNAAVKNAPAVVLERWLPRRHSYVYVGNPASNIINADLSTSFYGGIIMSSTNRSTVGSYFYFDHTLLKPHEAMIVQLEK